MERNCRECRYYAQDYMDTFCDHPVSHSEEEGGVYGRSLNYARDKNGFCGPEGTLFEEVTHNE